MTLYKLVIKRLWQIIGSRQESSRWTLQEFRRRFLENLRDCEWEPHPLYSVFTQFDGEYYLERKKAFLHKYRCFYAVSKTISPQKMIELGVCAGAGADAYLSATPGAEYTGIDTFGEPFSEADDSPWKILRTDEHSLWKPYDIAHRLLELRGFKRYTLLTANLRHLQKLPHPADLVIVDAAHDFENEYADLRLALTVDPNFIFVDDAEDEAQAKPAIEKFLREDLQERVEYTFPIDYIGGGLIIKLKK
jgi:predicted O-methyltransferase YrrM